MPLRALSAPYLLPSPEVIKVTTLGSSVLALSRFVLVWAHLLTGPPSRGNAFKSTYHAIKGS